MHYFLYQSFASFPLLVTHSSYKGYISLMQRHSFSAFISFSMSFSVALSRKKLKG